MGTAISVVIALVVIVAATRLVGALMVACGQPRVIGEILAGVLLGPTLLGMFAAPGLFGLCAPGQEQTLTQCLLPAEVVDSYLAWLGRGGVLVYMFAVGLVIDRAVLRRNARGVGVVGGATLLLPLLAGVALTPMLVAQGFAVDGASPVSVALLLGAMLSVTAVPVGARILDEYNLMRSDFASVAISAASLTTAATFAVVAVATTSGSAALARQGAAAAALLVVAAVGWRLGAGAARRGHRPLLSVALAVTLAAGGLAYASGLTVVMGGLAAGMVMPRHDALLAAVERWAQPLAERFLLLIFLATAGLAVNLREVEAGALTVVGLAVVLGVVTKLGGGAGAARACGFSWREGIALGALSNCRGLVVLIIGLAGLEAGVIEPAAHGLAVVLALVTTAMTGPIVKPLLREHA